MAVLVSVVPEPSSVPAAAPPSFSLTPNHGSVPMMKDESAGVATMVAVLPSATVAVRVGSGLGVPPLIVTVHQSSKFMTVRVAIPPSEPLEEALEPLPVASELVPAALAVEPYPIEDPEAPGSGDDDGELLLQAKAPRSASPAT